MENSTITQSIFAVFTEVSEWLVDAIDAVVPLFYNNGLTLIGNLSVISLGISVIFLLIGLVQGFLRFR